MCRDEAAAAAAANSGASKRSGCDLHRDRSGTKAIDFNYIFLNFAECQNNNASHNRPFYYGCQDILDNLHVNFKSAFQAQAFHIP